MQLKHMPAVALALFVLLLSAGQAQAGPEYPPFPGASSNNAALAQQTCPALQRNPDGTLNTTDFHFLGQRSFCPPGLCTVVTNPFNGQQYMVGFPALFNVYQAPDGRTIYTPTTATMLYMMATGWNPFPNQPPDSWAMNGFNAIIGALGGWERLGISPQSIISAVGKDPKTQALSDGDWQRVFSELGRDANFWLRLNLALNQAAAQNGQWLAWQAMVLLYCRDPLNNPPLPGPTPGGGNSTGGSSGGKVPPAPPPKVTPYTGDPFLEIWYAPKNPVVIGQDPEPPVNSDKRGTDLHLRAVSPSVVYKYQEHIIQIRCVFVGGSAGDGCGGRGSDWDTEEIERWEDRVQVVPDRMLTGSGQFTFNAQLTDASVGWIESELANRYPGVKVQHPEAWGLPGAKRFAVVENGLDGEDNHIVRMQTLQMPFNDPGVYTVRVRFTTTGTVFTPPAGVEWRMKTLGAPTFTPPRVIAGERDVKVWLLDSTLTQ